MIIALKIITFFDILKYKTIKILKKIYLIIIIA